MKNILEIKNLTKYYNKTLAVKNLNLTLNEGEIFGFIGPNGAGKSTTIRAIMNLINKTEGQVFINGEEVTKENTKLKRMIGYLPGEIFLYEDLTVKQMLDYHEKFYKINTNKRRKELVELLKLDEDKKIENLSLGNLKKLGIILALIHEPKILILDEATSGLDPIIQQTFFEILKKEKKKGTTIFYSTHILSEVSKICDRVGIIKNGELLKIENIKDIKAKQDEYVTITTNETEKIIKDLNLEKISKENNTIKFKNPYTPNELIKKLSTYNIEHILIEEPTLEDIILNYYK